MVAKSQTPARQLSKSEVSQITKLEFSRLDSQHYTASPGSGGQEREKFNEERERRKMDNGNDR